MKKAIRYVLCFSIALTSLFGTSFISSERNSSPDNYVYAEKNQENIFSYEVSADKKYCVINGLVKDADPKLYSEMVIPSTVEGIPVKEISGSAFRNNGAIKKVVIPDGVTDIGYAAFAFCSSLSEVSVPDTVKKVSAESFHGTPWLASVQKENDFVVVGDGILISYTGEEEKPELPEDIKAIGREAFSGLKKIRSAVIPAGVRYIHEYAFTDCPELTEITMGPAVEELGDFAVWNCGLKKITLPKSIARIGIASIGFAGNSSGIAAVDKEFTITGYESTISEWYANKNQIKFEKYEDRYDINGDCSVNGYDVSDVKAMVFSDVNIDDVPVLAEGDLNGDGILDVFDLMRVKKKVLGSN